jgi:hypothetical protein
MPGRASGYRQRKKGNSNDRDSSQNLQRVFRWLLFLNRLFHDGASGVVIGSDQGFGLSSTLLLGTLLNQGASSHLALTYSNFLITT